MFYKTHLLIVQLLTYFLEIIYLKVSKKKCSQSIKIIFILYELNIFIGCFFLFYIFYNRYLLIEMLMLICGYYILNNCIIVIICLVVYTFFNFRKERQC